jgi:hypothetical protein
MKPVLIIENSTDRLDVKKSKQDYVLQGPFTVFDEVNRNDRVYTADEFVPHVNQMMEKKSWGIIYGEMDHPECFEIALKNISHTVEAAYYNKEKNRIDGEIRLLNTHYGRDAKSLVDDGLPLFVSSRAAGITESNGKVKLKQLFTYDIVADPGFSAARMSVKNLNESNKYSDNSLLVLESSQEQLSKLSAQYDRLSNIKIMDLSDETKINELFNMNKNDLVTKKQLSDWSKYLTDQIKENNAKLTAKITETKGAPKITDSSVKLEDLVNYIDELEAQNEKMIKYLDYLTEKIQFSINSTMVNEKTTAKLIDYNNYLATKLDETISYSTYLAEELNNSIEYSNYIAEGLDKTIDYGNYLAENLDKAIDYSEYISETVSNTIKFSNYLAENLDKAIDYSNYISENLDATIGYTSYLGENLDINIGYVQYVAENLDTTINYADYISECVDVALSYSNKISESINKSNGVISEKIVLADQFLNENKKPKTETLIKEDNSKKTSKKLGDLKHKKETVTETVQPIKEELIAEKVEVNAELKSFISNTTTNETLTEKITKLIAETKKREASKDIKPNFYEFLIADDIKSFESLIEDEQENIKVAMNESTGYYSRADVLSIMKQVLDKNKPSAEELLINNIPTDIKPIWEKVDNKMKQSILSQARFYDTTTTTLIEHFWNTRNFDFAKPSNKVLLESNNPFENMNKLSEDQIDLFTEKFRRLNK